MAVNAPQSDAALATSLTPDRIMQLGFGFFASKTLLTAVELGLFTILAEAPADAEALRRRLQLHERAVLDFLDALVSLGMLDRTGGVYRNTPETALFLDRNLPSYQGGILEMANARLYHFWGSLTEALRTGRPQCEVKDHPDWFEAMYRDPNRLRVFLEGMTGLSKGAGMAIGQRFPWHRYRSFGDVGTAQGGAAVQIALAQPHLRGIGFDLPPVKPIFEDYVAGHGLQERLHFTAGDFFADEFPAVDVILMGHILHDWDLPTKQLLIQKAYHALPSGGALIVHEAIIDDDRRTNAFGLLLSLTMLLETPGGFDFTGGECMAWMRAAGFRETYVEHLMGPDSIVVAIK